MGNTSKTSLFVSTISAEHDFLMGTLYSTFCVLSLLANGVLLSVACCRKSSLKPAEFFIINLSISDLGMTVTLFPLATSSSFARRWLFGEITCTYYAFCGVLFALCSLTNLTILSAVCCLKVCFPHYGNRFSSSHARVLVLGAWCYAVVFAVGPMAEWGRYGPEPYGTACCVDWHVPRGDAHAVTYVVALFLFGYAVPCTVILTSYAFILLTVRGSHLAMRQHMSPQSTVSNAHVLIVKLSVAVCAGFLAAWSPYAVVAIWAASSGTAQVPPVAFALAAIFAKSSTVYNPIVYLLFKPNFRKSLYRGAAHFRGRLQQGRTSQRNHGDISHSTHLSDGPHDWHGRCRHCVEDGALCVAPAQRTARVLVVSAHSEVRVSQISDRLHCDFL
ncbi:opsin-5-like [Brienomyrus brachyistius]|uniref:opsin-5-like n=1 Tax=Brienomyrus brachyistius TaxID=42636 RepID=UPI0020B1D825|nr:opsin-5-like [Brienomyrus brachyistius]